MYRSKEIRWFFRERNGPIAHWFSDHGKTFPKTDPRTDYYLPNPGNEGMSVKLREGNIEIKQREGMPALHHLTKHAVGYLEDWVKWSFDVNDDDALTRRIIKERKYNWTEVYKERLGVKLSANPDGTIAVLDIKNIIPAGCQVEYTRLLIKGQEWFTFGLEWFGEEYLDLDAKIIEEVVGSSHLEVKNSKGYNGFLAISD
jgi:hypothetical protein